MVGCFEFLVNCNSQGHSFKLAALRVQFPKLFPEFLNFRHPLRSLVEIDALGQLLYALPDDFHRIAIGKYLSVALDLVVLGRDLGQLELTAITSHRRTPQAKEPARRRWTAMNRAKCISCNRFVSTKEIMSTGALFLMMVGWEFRLALRAIPEMGRTF